MKKLYYIILSIGLILSACTDNNKDSVFDKTTDERVAELIKKYADALEASENGWKAEYYPNDEEYGAFGFVIQFNKAEGTAIMYSDLIQEGHSTSTYRYQQQQEPSLVFDTFGLLHVLSDPANGVVGEGFQGEFEFYFREITDNQITLEGKLHGREMILTKATPEDIQKLTESYNRITNIVGDPLQSVFRNIEINDSPIASFEYNQIGRFAILSYIENNIYKQIKAPVNPTPEGFLFKEPVVINEVSIGGFIYDETENLFIDAVSGAKLLYSDVPGTPLPSYDFGVTANNIRYNYMEPNKSSLAWNQFYAAYTKSLAGIGIELQRFYIRDLQEAQPYLHIYTNLGNLWYDVNFEVKEDGKVYFVLTGNTNAPSLTPYFEPLFDVIVNSTKGYYLRNTGGLLNYTNGTVSLINADNPAYEINYYDF